MERVKLKAQGRETGRRGLLNRLRQEGLVPAILYGRGMKPEPVALQTKALVQAIKKGGMNVLFEIESSEKGDGKPLLAMLKDFQTDVVTHDLIHVDLLKIDLNHKVTVKVPVLLSGKSVGEENGGIVEHIRREIECRCLPTNIPESIEVDITPLEIGHALHVNDLKLPEGVEVVGEADFTIVAVTAPRKEEELAPAPAEGVPVEGEAAAPAEGGAAAEGEAKKEGAAPKEGKEAPEKKG